MIFICAFLFCTLVPKFNKHFLHLLVVACLWHDFLLSKFLQDVFQGLLHYSTGGIQACLHCCHWDRCFVLCIFKEKFICMPAVSFYSCYSLQWDGHVRPASPICSPLCPGILFWLEQSRTLHIPVSRWQQILYQINKCRTSWNTYDLGNMELIWFVEQSCGMLQTMCCIKCEVWMSRHSVHRLMQNSTPFLLVSIDF